MKKCIRLILAISLIIYLLPYELFAQAPLQNTYITAKNGTGYFPLSADGKPAPLCTSSEEYPGVTIAVKNLQKDITSVTKTTPDLLTDNMSNEKQIVLIGTLGKNKLIDKLVKDKKLDIGGLAGKWETHITQVVQNPFAGVKQALVIVGSDKRGTIFGIYDLSAQIGVSPWYWWADVPIKEQKNLYVIPGRYTDGEPAVKYRGIFINDEAPAFSGWTREKFGGVNHQVYEKIFELILRLKGNYLWPAMWGNAFNDDDKLDPALADEYGIVMGTSHHEPMDRAQQEWKRYGKGPWNYDTNGEVLRDFWKQGIENMGDKETIVTVGMRGDGDMPMTVGSNIALLEKIVGDQRKIIADVTGKDASKTPQMWALYKEVQDYYDKGMRVPDDVTLLLCDDNWGNIRKLPKLTEANRTGGYGIYYHFDYVGGPRNYKWLNTNPISKTWEQMHLAYEYGIKQVWVVNVGDLKPMEFPISFFLDFAWSPNKIPAGSLDKYTEQWAQQQFGPEHAAEIANILTLYTKYNGRRKPELLDQNTYSLTNYREFETVVSDYNKLREEAEQLEKKIPAEYKDAYYELTLHPVQACSNLNELYFATAKNKWYAQQGRSATNDMADKVQELFNKDAEISNYYNKTLAGGKWDHMMDQTHIGYTGWQEPRKNNIPTVTHLDIPAAADMGVSVEGSSLWWPNSQTAAALPEFDSYNKQSGYVEIFNRGQTSFSYTIASSAPCLHISSSTGKIYKQERLWVSVDWTNAPTGISNVPITISGPNGTKVIVQAVIKNIKPGAEKIKGFMEENDYIAIEGEHFSKEVIAPGINWDIIPGYGRTLSGITTFPVTAKSQAISASSPHLEYIINASDTGLVKTTAYVGPTLDFTGLDGLHYAVSIDDEQPQVVNINTDNLKSKSFDSDAADVSNNVKILTSSLHISKPGRHVLKYWMVDPGVVLERLVIDFGGLKPSYLGPPESYSVK